MLSPFTAMMRYASRFVAGTTWRATSGRAGAGGPRQRRASPEEHAVAYPGRAPAVCGIFSAGSSGPTGHMSGYAMIALTSVRIRAHDAGDS